MKGVWPMAALLTLALACGSSPSADKDHPSVVRPE